MPIDTLPHVLALQLTVVLFSAAIPKVVKMDTVGQLRHANIDTGYASRGHADKFIHLRDQLNAMAR